MSVPSTRSESEKVSVPFPSRLRVDPFPITTLKFSEELVLRVLVLIRVVRVVRVLVSVPIRVRVRVRVLAFVVVVLVVGGPFSRTRSGRVEEVMNPLTLTLLKLRVINMRNERNDGAFSLD